MSNWKTIMNHPHFDFVSDIRGLNYTRLDDIYELFGEWEYSDERLAILRECYEKPKNGVELTDSVIQEWKDWHKEDLDINNSIHKCPHIPSGTQCECCDNIAIAYFEDLPACRDCYNNAVAYYKTETGIDLSLSDDE